jgi:hypothetical protein
MICVAKYEAKRGMVLLCHQSAVNFSVTHKVLKYFRAYQRSGSDRSRKFIRQKPEKGK